MRGVGEDGWWQRDYQKEGVRPRLGGRADRAGHAPVLALGAAAAWCRHVVFTKHEVCCGHRGGPTRKHGQVAPDSPILNPDT